MIAAVPSATLAGYVGRPVTVEVHVSNGLPAFTVVGLPDAAVREARDRVRAALLSSGLSWPLQRVTVNLAPSGLRKGGAGLDLPIAVGLLVATAKLAPRAALGWAFVGELGLDGSLHHVPGMIALADAVEAERLVVPAEDEGEAATMRAGAVRGAASLHQVVESLAGRAPWPAFPAVDAPRRRRPLDPGVVADRYSAVEPDLSDVRGQRVGRRALEVAAAGGHHLLMIGPPGSGKTMLAERLPGLLPRLTRAEAVEVSRVHSAAGFQLPRAGLIDRPPFRAPHHGASAVSIVGGGTRALRPGEISLASCGVLFLDEMGEFPTAVLDAMRQPLEEGLVRVSRAHATMTFPARFLLVGAMNPCPCGRAGDPGGCRCSEPAKARYGRRLSGPLLDRFDLVVPLRRPDPDEFLAGAPGEPTSAVAARVAAVRVAARRRGVPVNAALAAETLEPFVPLSSSARTLLDRHFRTGALSARGVHRVRRVARTVADLEDLEGASELIAEHHVAEALALRAARSLLGAGDSA